MNKTKLSQQVGTFTVQHNASNIIHHLCCTDVKDKYNMSPLHWACMTGKKGVVEYLVEKANCDISECSLLYIKLCDKQ